MADDSLDVRRLRSALEFAILIAQEGQKVRPQIASPPGLAKFTHAGRLPRSALPAVRRIVEGDDEFRRRLASVATADLVDAVGLLWLRRPDGWEAEIRDAIAATEAAEADANLAAQLKQAERRRSAAERAAGRATAELAARDLRIAELEAERAFLADEVVARDELVAATRGELAALKVEIRHARDRERAARDRAETLARALDDPARAGDRSGPVHSDSEDSDRVVDRPTVGGSEPEAIGGPAADVAGERPGDDAGHGLAVASVVDAEELAAVAAAATELAARLVSLSGDTDADDAAPGDDDGGDGDAASGVRTSASVRRSRRRRRPLPMPGGVMSDSDRATRFLLESGGTVIIDGYNVAKLAWPDLSLEQQRDRLITAAENLVRRWGTEITVSFDGAAICGAHTTRRTNVRVVYSDADQIADDWIRDEVRRLPVSRAVTVVSNDREVQRDVRAMGANVLSSEQLIAAFA